MLRDDRLYLGHMLDTARRAERLALGKTRADFEGSELLRLARIPQQPAQLRRSDRILPAA